MNATYTGIEEGKKQVMEMRFVTAFGVSRIRGACDLSRAMMAKGIIFPLNSGANLRSSFGPIGLHTNVMR